MGADECCKLSHSKRKTACENTLIFIFIYFISIFILLSRRKATEALTRMVGNYPNLLSEIPRYCCPLVI